MEKKKKLERTHIARCRRKRRYKERCSQRRRSSDEGIKLVTGSVLSLLLIDELTEIKEATAHRLLFFPFQKTTKKERNYKLPGQESGVDCE